MQTPTSPAAENIRVPASSGVMYSLPSMTDRVIEQALAHYISDHIGYKKKFAKQMLLTDVLTEGIYIYKLETFGEMRTKSSSSRAYSGYSIDSERNGLPPRMWDIPVHPQALFEDSEATVDIPHTEYVRLCIPCKGKGYVKCTKCEGIGSVFCVMCQNNAPLIWNGDRCVYCHRWGNGGLVVCCDVCRGNRELKCTSCKGHGSILQCETLTVTWLNKVNEVAHKDCAVPFMKLTEARAKTVFSEEKENLQPLVHAPSPFIASKSERLLRKHQGAFPNILKQRHSIRVVQLTKVLYSWKNKTGEFYIYGLENKVHFKNFPAKWTSCTLM